MKRLQDAPASLMSPVGSFTDKARVGILRTKIATMQIDKILEQYVGHQSPPFRKNENNFSPFVLTYVCFLFVLG